MGIDPSRLGRVGQSFSSTLYRDVDGKYVLAFAGSDDAGDWRNNFVGVLSASDEVKDAAELGVYLKNELAAAGVGSSGLSFTGHSLEEPWLPRRVSRQGTRQQLSMQRD